MCNSIYNDVLNKFYDSVVWTHKIQRTYLETLEKRRKIISVFEIVFSTLSGTATIFFAVFGVRFGTIISSIITLLSIILSTVLDKVETKQDIDLFRKSSNGLWTIKCRIEELYSRIKANHVPDEEVKQSLDLFQFMFSGLVENLPTIPDRFVDLAKKKLEERKDEEPEQRLL